MDFEDRRWMKKIGLATTSVLIVIIIFAVLYWLLSTAVILRSQIINFLLPFLFAFVVAYILKPAVDYMEENKIPRILAILILYAIIGSFLVFVGGRAFATIVNEVQKLISIAPQYARDIQFFLMDLELWIERHDLPIMVTETIRENIAEAETELTEYLDRIVDVESLLAFALNIFGHFLSLVAFPIILFYFLKDTDLIKKNLSFLIPGRFRKRFLFAFRDINRTIGAYIRSQIIICGFIGLLTYLGLMILGVDFALVLGIFAGITNIIPYFGPFIGAIPSTVVALLQTPTLAIKVIILITIIQQIESQIVAPQVFGKNLAIHPLAVITVLIAGGQFFGILGMILAVPVLAITRVVVRHLAFDFWLAEKE
ncbi:AI-2E family transporter [Natranaerobius thermophilus]|uniref:Permease n=1 Tax=Natranaerobius thermophilus (strain ATCC BAA-1301 / DSM 18059 / JW/NM-WN-LF) TaxID=457570 RepID=B2A5J8_NATTJ|nr:AI-2E family transporter [Natranaerobius thermophilus]ACB85353.1 protein of unknown function UPF0118 [Natranaerobius thermophilus JW/NM-WN-LF]